MISFKNLNKWVVLALTFIYIVVMNFYFEYIINREVDSLIQVICTFVALMYTVFQLSLIASSLLKTINKKEEEEK